MTILNQQPLYGVLAVRYDVGFSQDIADQVNRLNERDIEFLDIKELNDLIAEYRNRIRSLIAGCRHTDRKTTAGQVYASYERIFARRQIADLWKLYRIACADCQEITAVYMERLTSNHLTSHPTERKHRAAA